MKNYLFLCIFFLIISCTNNKSVYWCGDHPCINKKEKEAYFKKTMIVEVRELKKDNSKDISEYEKLMKQAQTDEKKRITSEKELAKQVRLEEKRRIKEEKELAKQARLDKKREKDNTWKSKKKMSKNDVSKTEIKDTATNTDLVSANISSDKFNTLAERIIIKNKSKPYPNINDIPN